MRLRSVPSGRAIAAATGAIVLAAGLLWWPRAVAFPPPGTLRGANVLLVTIDTLRADRLGAYGATHATPSLDALAAAGVRFTRAYAHAVMTLPSHASLLTGQVPPRHGVRNNGTFRLGSEADTVAERLKHAGYRTGAFVGAFVLDRRFGLAQGFDTYDDRLREESALDFRIAERPAHEVLSAASDWVHAQPGGSPWFAWVHLFDPHTPYVAASPSSGDAYTDEVLRVDREVGSFLQALRASGRLDRTLIVVTADHGESLGEHGEATHGLFAYESTLRVPLIIAGPGIGKGVVDHPTSHVDLTATLLALVGARDAALDGRSLSGAVAQSRPIYFEALDAQLTRDWAPLTGLISGNWKYIDLPVPELYDLGADRGEATNLAEQDAGRRRALEKELAQWERASGDSTRVALDDEAAARLKALGYASASGRPSAIREYTAADDPKTLLPVHRTFMAALDRAERNETEEALRDLRQVIAARPSFTGAYTAAASILIGAGRAPEAVRMLLAARNGGVTSPDVDRRLAAAYVSTGQFEQAVALLRGLTAPPTEDFEALNLMGVALLQTGQAQDARRMLKRAIELDPTSAGVWTNLGLLEIRAGGRADAAAAFRRAVEIDPGAVDAWRGLGAAAMSATDARGAIEAWTRAVALEPEDSTTLFNLCVVLAEVAPRDALPYLDRFLALSNVESRDRVRIAAIRGEILRTQKTPGAPQGARR
jgi:arylsulfatase A-like enzyme/Flp pilus assembly protein TadD